MAGGRGGLGDRGGPEPPRLPCSGNRALLGEPRGGAARLASAESPDGDQIIPGVGRTLGPGISFLPGSLCI